MFFSKIKSIKCVFYRSHQKDFKSQNFFSSDVKKLLKKYLGSPRSNILPSNFCPKFWSNFFYELK